MLDDSKKEYLRHSGLNLLYIVLWYLFAFSLSLYNKWIFSSSFPFPLFMTSWHMLMQWLLSWMLLSILPSLRTTTNLSTIEYVKKIVPCSLSTALDIGLSNLSLKTITLTFYTMCKSSSLIWVLLFAFIFRLEKPSFSIAGIILVIAVGVIMMVSAETNFVLSGAIQVLLATAAGGLRWSLTQILLKNGQNGLNNPVIILYYLAPVMFACLIILSLIFESWSDIAQSDYFIHGTLSTIKSIVMIVSPGFLAFGMVLSEFKLIARSSIITMSIAGIFKELLTIFLSSVIFGDILTPINITGMAITIIGIFYEQVQTNEPIFDLEDINISNTTENTSIPQESISNSTKVTL
ncbi:TPT-domain-containing protein [Wallemia mellicola]|uniref:TPT-domain-containing protein n=1 Tax=Wallemia mellicola TaxID=1708541 RepID=A0A4T0NKA1_9BASI|nr:TPT-domain-containing protein [Wallemia mellicola]